MHVVSATQLDPQELPPGTLQDLNQTLSAQLESVAKAICKARRVVVVCGALIYFAIFEMATQRIM